MPEGDTIFRAGRTLDRTLAGQVVNRFESTFPSVNRINEDHPVVGRTIVSVASRGKHLLMTFSGDLVLHTHMRMNGSWHLYRPGAPWRRASRDMRLLVGTAKAVAVGFNVPVADLLTSRELERHGELRALGPDLLAPTIDRAEVFRRMRARGRLGIGEVLLDQRVVAGIGNVFMSETLFLAGVDPFAATASLTDDELGLLVDVGREQLNANVLSRSQTLSPSIGRRTTRSLDPRERLWVYGRGGKPCRRCGSTIQAKKTGLHAHLTYWCARCQPSRR
jgi:endonuclease-8